MVEIICEPGSSYCYNGRKYCCDVRGTRYLDCGTCGTNPCSGAVCKPNPERDGQSLKVSPTQICGECKRGCKYAVNSTTRMQWFQFIQPATVATQASIAAAGLQWKPQNVANWISNNIKYKSDWDQYGVDEFWQTPLETLKLKTGDCEDYAILGASMLRALGYDARVEFGVVNWLGGVMGMHAWVEFPSGGYWYTFEGINGAIYKGAEAALNAGYKTRWYEIHPDHCDWMCTPNSGDHRIKCPDGNWIYPNNCVQKDNRPAYLLMPNGTTCPKYPCSPEGSYKTDICYGMDCGKYDTRLWRCMYGQWWPTQITCDESFRAKCLGTGAEMTDIYPGVWVDEKGVPIKKAGPPPPKRTGEEAVGAEAPGQSASDYIVPVAVLSGAAVMLLLALKR